MLSQSGSDESPECDFSAADLYISNELIATKNLTSWKCSRPAWDQTDAPRCVWHAEKANKSKKELMKTKGNGDLAGAYLTNTDLTGAELRGANLTGAYLRDADLTEAMLVNADLTDASLENIDLTKAKLNYADLAEAHLDDADLTRAYVNYADLPGAELRHANLTKTSLNHTDLPDADLRYADLTGASLWYADLTGADLHEADLIHAYLRHADLSDANLPHTDLSGASLWYADLPNADLREAEFAATVNLRETLLTESDLFGAVTTEVDAELLDAPLSPMYPFRIESRGAIPATLREADMRRVDLEGVDFGFIDLREVAFTSADCEGTRFDEANLNRATFENADLSSADFSQAYLYQTRFDGAQINDQTQFDPDGEVGNPSTDNACRYDSEIPPEAPTRCLSDHAASENDTDPEEARARRARSTYNRLEELAGENGFPELKSEMFVRRQDARRELLTAQGKRLKSSFAWVQKSLFNYGESFLRVATISTAIVLGSWLWFLSSGTVETESGQRVALDTVTNDPILVWETFYHSISVFFAGQGPLEPTGVAGQVSTVGVRASGPVLLALLIFVLGRRAAR